LVCWSSGGITADGSLELDTKPAGTASKVVFGLCLVLGLLLGSWSFQLALHQTRLWFLLGFLVVGGMTGFGFSRWARSGILRRAERLRRCGSAVVLAEHSAYHSGELARWDRRSDQLCEVTLNEGTDQTLRIVTEHRTAPGFDCLRIVGGILSGRYFSEQPPIRKELVIPIPTEQLEAVRGIVEQWVSRAYFQSV